MAIHGRTDFEFAQAPFLFPFVISSRPISETTQHPNWKYVNLTTYLHLMWR